jgi:hypothetical protein
MTTRLSASDFVVVPLTPVTMSGYVPGTAVADATNVRELPAEPVTEAGVNVAVTPAGRPLTLNVTVPSKLPESFTVTLLAVVMPCSTVTVPAVEIANEPDDPKGVAGTTGYPFWTS